MKTVNLHHKQKEIAQSNARFKVIRAGRRGGKTTYVIEEMLFCAVSEKDRYIFYTAPTQIQARDIIWESLKSRVGTIATVNEARLEMKVPTVDGGTSTIYVAGWENRENFRGKKAHLEVFDELDTMRNFFIGWQEIFRPALTDTKGKAIFIGTPKKENPNLKRLEKVAETDLDYQCFHWKTIDNPVIDPGEIAKAKSELDYNTFLQEYEAEYVENIGALFSYSALIDVFTNTITKDTSKYLVIDIAGEGNDSTVFSYWEGLEEVWQEKTKGLNTEMIINKAREYAAQYQIPYSHIVVDAIGIGEGVASSSLLNGVIAYKSSYSAIRTEASIVSLPNVHYLKEAPLVTDFSNLRSQCVFKLAQLVNDHKIASKLNSQAKEEIIEELSLYQDVSKGDGKRYATGKDDIKVLLGRSPDRSDTWIMRMYFEIVNKLSPQNSEEVARAKELQESLMRQRRVSFNNSSTK